MSLNRSLQMSLRKYLLLIFLLTYSFLGLLFLYGQLQPFSESKCNVHEMFEDISECGQDDSEILEYIRKYHLEPPSKLKLNLTHNVYNPMDGNVREALKGMLNKKRKGFFVECGANNGEFLSQTIDLEMNYGWTGLLVEASPTLYSDLKTRHRKAWLTDTCLSSSKPQRVEFVKHKDTFPEWRIGNGRINPDKHYKEPSIIKEGWEKEQYVSEGNVECFPLYSVLKAMNVYTVDLFSLDVEGHEYTILKDIPFHKLDIKVIFVEHFNHTKKDKDAIRDLLLNNGYTLFIETNSDFIFVRNLS